MMASSALRELLRSVIASENETSDKVTTILDEISKHRAEFIRPDFAARDVTSARMTRVPSNSSAVESLVSLEEGDEIETFRARPSFPSSSRRTWSLLAEAEALPLPSPQLTDQEPIFTAEETHMALGGHSGRQHGAGASWQFGDGVAHGGLNFPFDFSPEFGAPGTALPLPLPARQVGEDSNGMWWSARGP